MTSSSRKIPSYTPPYPSPLEDHFALQIIKYLKETVELIPQYEVKTPWGNFYHDFVVKDGESKIAFECDGKEYHDKLRDEWRDIAILGTSNISAIYRFRGSDLTYHFEDCLYFTSHYDPQIFTDRALRNLKVLASDAIKAGEFDSNYAHRFIIYPIDDDNPTSFQSILDRRSKKQNIEWDSHGEKIFQHIMRHKGGRIADLVEEHLRNNYKLD